jgi:ABC-type sugar transport system permease subunit
MILTNLRKIARLILTLPSVTSAVIKKLMLAGFFPLPLAFGTAFKTRRLVSFIEDSVPFVSSAVDDEELRIKGDALTASRG